MGPLFAPGLSDEVKAWLKSRAESKYARLNETLAGKKFLVGDSFTVADSYTYIVLSWSGYLGIELAAYPAVKAYFDGIAALPHVQAAHARMAGAPKTAV